jgi:hypothetical protein
MALTGMPVLVMMFELGERLDHTLAVTAQGNKSE